MVVFFFLLVFSIFSQNAVDGIRRPTVARDNTTVYTVIPHDGFEDEEEEIINDSNENAQYLESFALKQKYLDKICLTLLFASLDPLVRAGVIKKDSNGDFIYNVSRGLFFLEKALNLSFPPFTYFSHTQDKLDGKIKSIETYDELLENEMSITVPFIVNMCGDVYKRKFCGGKGKCKIDIDNLNDYNMSFKKIDVLTFYDKSVLNAVPSSLFSEDNYKMDNDIISTTFYYRNLKTNNTSDDIKDNQNSDDKNKELKLESIKYTIDDLIYTANPFDAVFYDTSLPFLKKSYIQKNFVELYGENLREMLLDVLTIKKRRFKSVQKDFCDIFGSIGKYLRESQISDLCTFVEDKNQDEDMDVNINNDVLLNNVYVYGNQDVIGSYKSFLRKLQKDINSDENLSNKITVYSSINDKNYEDYVSVMQQAFNRVAMYVDKIKSLSDDLLVTLGIKRVRRNVIGRIVTGKEIKKKVEHFINLVNLLYNAYLEWELSLITGKSKEDFFNVYDYLTFFIKNDICQSDKYNSSIKKIKNKVCKKQTRILKTFLKNDETLKLVKDFVEKQNLSKKSEDFKIVIKKDNTGKEYITIEVSSLDENIVFGLKDLAVYFHELFLSLSKIFNEKIMVAAKVENGEITAYRVYPNLFTYLGKTEIFHNFFDLIYFNTNSFKGIYANILLKGRGVLFGNKNKKWFSIGDVKQILKKSYSQFVSKILYFKGEINDEYNKVVNLTNNKNKDYEYFYYKLVDYLLPYSEGNVSFLPEYMNYLAELGIYSKNSNFRKKEYERKLKLLYVIIAQRVEKDVKNTVFARPVLGWTAAFLISKIVYLRALYATLRGVTSIGTTVTLGTRFMFDTAMSVYFFGNMGSKIIDLIIALRNINKNLSNLELNYYIDKMDYLGYLGRKLYITSNIENLTKEIMIDALFVVASFIDFIKAVRMVRGVRNAENLGRVLTETLSLDVPVLDVSNVLKGKVYKNGKLTSIFDIIKGASKNAGKFNPGFFRRLRVAYKACIDTMNLSSNNLFKLMLFSGIFYDGLQRAGNTVTGYIKNNPDPKKLPYMIPDLGATLLKAVANGFLLVNGNDKLGISKDKISKYFVVDKNNIVQITDEYYQAKQKGKGFLRYYKDKLFPERKEGQTKAGWLLSQSFFLSLTAESLSHTVYYVSGMAEEEYGKQSRLAIAARATSGLLWTGLIGIALKASLYDLVLRNACLIISALSSKSILAPFLPSILYVLVPAGTNLFYGYFTSDMYFGLRNIALQDVFNVKSKDEQEKEDLFGEKDNYIVVNVDLQDLDSQLTNLVDSVQNYLKEKYFPH